VTKRTGLGMRLFVGGYDLSGDINSFAGINGGNAPLDFTDITQEANARAGGKRAGATQFVSFFNDATDRAHPRLSSLPTADVDAMGLLGVAIGSAAFNIRAKQIDYNPNEAPDGSLLFTTDLQSTTVGLEWGEMLTVGRRTESAATNGASLDGVASSSFGWSAWLQVFALASGTPTIKLQDSADDSAWLDLTGGGFGTIAANSGARIVGGSTATLRRYVRVITTGTFSGLDFAVSLTRNDFVSVVP
jgi:hypothetical protein